MYYDSATGVFRQVAFGPDRVVRVEALPG